MALHTILIFLTILTTLTTPTHALTHFASPTTCLIIGDPDVYGPGIRLSFYLQWAAILLATTVAPSGASFARTTTNILTISVFANSLRGFSNGGLVAAEWWIVTFLCFFLNLGNWPSSRQALRESVASIGVSLCIYAMVMCMECWVWFRGLDIGHGRENGDCEVKISVFFHPVDVYDHGWRTAFKVLAAVDMVAALVFAVVGIGILLLSLAVPFFDVEEYMQHWVDGDDRRMVSVVVKCLLSVFQMILGAFSIAFVELTIKFNDIQLPQGYTSSGQLIPVLIGVLTLASAVFSVWKRIGKMAIELRTHS
ncbi:hypothetical protein BT63DRAFT_427006 [Microthyrium microscopicum]|uniref:Integral membrane protein n=1 Tax=Microthyrium microscopicum TaxID=703497 RepID=A0A6A6U543_9PEZI|nr:hypothetical protein BT63DRAFT_427006 [Microthyrium microscopicum]